MANGLRWWVIPGAMIVLLRVLTLGGDVPPEPRPAPVPASATSGLREVQVRDAAGRRTPLALPPADRAFVVALGPEHVGARVAMSLWRRVDGAREAAPCMTLRPRVRGDGTVPFANVAPGVYDVVVHLADGSELRAEQVSAPGRVAFGAAAPGR